MHPHIHICECTHKRNWKAFLIMINLMCPRLIKVSIANSLQARWCVGSGLPKKCYRTWGYLADMCSPGPQHMYKSPALLHQESPLRRSISCGNAALQPAHCSGCSVSGPSWASLFISLPLPRSLSYWISILQWISQALTWFRDEMETSISAKMLKLRIPRLQARKVNKDFEILGGSWEQGKGAEGGNWEKDSKDGGTEEGRLTKAQNK